MANLSDRGLCLLKLSNPTNFRSSICTIHKGLIYRSIESYIQLFLVVMTNMFESVFCSDDSYYLPSATFQVIGG
jgi:hypothetical protein